MTKINRFLILLFFVVALCGVSGSAFAGCTNKTLQDENGNDYVACLDSDGNATTGVMKGCTPLPVKLAEDKKCIFCPLFKTLFNSAQTISQKAMEATATPVRNVMALAFAVYIAFMVLGHVSSLTKQDAPKFITGLLGNTFKFFVAFLLLTQTDAIYYYVINPLLATSLEFGGVLLFEASSGIAECKTTFEGGLDGILPDVLFNNLDCFIRGVQKEIAFAQSAGSSLMCVGRKEASGALGIWDFSMVFSGFAIYVCTLLMSFAFAFYLIDSVVMLGVIGALMSFLIACWPFKLTSQYTNKGFSLFMNIFFVFVFMGIVVSINTQLIKSALETGGLGSLEEALSGDDIDSSKKALDINAVGFLIVVCCCFFGFKFSAKAAQLAGNMAAGGGLDIGAKLGGLVTSGPVNAAKKIGGAAAAPVVNKVKETAGAAKDWGMGKLAQGAKYVRDHKPVRAGQSWVSADAVRPTPTPTPPAPGGGGDNSNPTNPNSEVDPNNVVNPTDTPIVGGDSNIEGRPPMANAAGSAAGKIRQQGAQNQILRNFDSNRATSGSENFVESGYVIPLSPESRANAKAEQYVNNFPQQGGDDTAAAGGGSQTAESGSAPRQTAYSEEGQNTGGKRPMAELKRDCDATLDMMEQARRGFEGAKGTGGEAAARQAYDAATTRYTDANLDLKQAELNQAKENLEKAKGTSGEAAAQGNYNKAKNQAGDAMFLRAQHQTNMAERKYAEAMGTDQEEAARRAYEAKRRVSDDMMAMQEQRAAEAINILTGEGPRKKS